KSVPAAAGQLFAWEHIGISETRLPVLRFMQGAAATTLFLMAVTFAAVRPVHRLPETAAASGQAPAGGVAGDASPGVPARGGASRGPAPGAQSAAAKGAAEQQFAAWLEEFNNGDKAKFQAFLEKNYPDQAKRIDGIMDFRAMTGGFDL